MHPAENVTPTTPTVAAYDCIHIDAAGYLGFEGTRTAFGYFIDLHAVPVHQFDGRCP